MMIYRKIIYYKTKKNKTADRGFISDYSNRAKMIYDAVKANQKDGMIIGVVVTGTKDELKTLIGKPYIKATSLGATVDKY